MEQLHRRFQVRRLMKILWPCSQGAEGCDYALDNFCGASDLVASGFQFARGRRSDPPAAGGWISGFGYQFAQRPPNCGVMGTIQPRVDYFKGG